MVIVIPDYKNNITPVIYSIAYRLLGIFSISFIPHTAPFATFRLT